MDRSQASLSEEQQIALKDTLERANAFEEMVRTPGWKFVQAYYENKVRLFTNKLLMSNDKYIEEFSQERLELIGIRKLLGEIDSTLETLQQERRKDNGNQNTNDNGSE